MKIKKLLVLLAFFMLGTLISFGHVQAASDNYLNQVKQKGTLVVGTSADYPPYEFTVKTSGKTDYVG